MVRLARRGAIAALLAPLSVASAAGAQPAPQATRIFSGSVSESCGFAGTVLLLSRSDDGSRSVCTGSLVHPEIVVYAAHCGDQVSDIYFGEHVLRHADDGSYPLDSPARTIALPERSCHVYPGSAYISGIDYAFCRLPAPVDDVPIVPILMGCEVAILSAPQPVIVAGFGLDEDKNLGIKHWVTTTTQVASTTKVQLGSKTGSTCQGDSGGPAFVQLPVGGSLVPRGDDSWRLIGVDSFGADSTTCAAPSYFSLLYHAVPWIEATSGVDISPCTSAEGVWQPTAACAGFPTDLQAVAGSWSQGCQLPARAAAASTTCGAAYGSSTATMRLVSPANDQPAREGEASNVVVDVGEAIGAMSLSGQDALQVDLDGQRLDLVDERQPPAYGFGPVVWTVGEHTLVASVAEAGGAVRQQQFSITIQPPLASQGGVAGGGGAVASADGAAAGASAADCAGGPTPELAGPWGLLALARWRRRWRGRAASIALAAAASQLAGCGVNLGVGSSGGSASPSAGGDATSLPGAAGSYTVEVSAAPDAAGATGAAGSDDPVETAVPAAAVEVTGSVAGNPVPAADAVYSYGRQSNDYLLFVYLGDQAASCARHQAGTPLAAGRRELRLQLRSAAGGYDVPLTGSFAVVPLARAVAGEGDVAVVNYLVADGKCGNTLPATAAYAASGTVEIKTHLAAEGSYLSANLTDVTFAGGEVLAGSLVARACATDVSDDTDLVASCR